MAARARVLAGVPVGGVIAALGRAALLTGTQVDPPRTDLHALLALPALRVPDGGNRGDVNTRLVGHGLVLSDEPCVHIAAITTVRHAKRRECEECVKIGARWVHLRTCQECGTTQCCDDSPNRHASKHARASGHPVIASAEPGERWLYCYPHDAFAEY